MSDIVFNSLGHALKSNDLEDAVNNSLNANQAYRGRVKIQGRIYEVKASINDNGITCSVKRNAGLIRRFFSALFRRCFFSRQPRAQLLQSKLTDIVNKHLKKHHRQDLDKESLENKSDTYTESLNKDTYAQDTFKPENIPDSARTYINSFENGEIKKRVEKDLNKILGDNMICEIEGIPQQTVYNDKNSHGIAPLGILKNIVSGVTVEHLDNRELSVKLYSSGFGRGVLARDKKGVRPLSDPDNPEAFKAETEIEFRYTPPANDEAAHGKITFTKVDWNIEIKSNKLAILA